MNKEEMLNNQEMEEVTASEIWEKLYNKELNCKKNILEYIDLVRILKKENASEKKLQDTYNYIYEHIEALKDSIKPNTIMHLKNSLKSQLGKYVKEKDPKPLNHFIEFFKKAYPADARRKDFTWVLMDIDRISEQQIWTTLTYINRECMHSNLRLDSNQKKDIFKMIEKLVTKNNIKYINNLRSLEKLTNILGISIISVGEIFKIRHDK